MADGNEAARPRFNDQRDISGHRDCGNPDAHVRLLSPGRAAGVTTTAVVERESDFSMTGATVSAFNV